MISARASVRVRCTVPLTAACSAASGDGLAPSALQAAQAPSAWRGLSGQGTYWRQCLPSVSGWRPPFRSPALSRRPALVPLTGPWVFWVTWSSWPVRCFRECLNKPHVPQTGPWPSCRMLGASALEWLGTFRSGPRPCSSSPHGCVFHSTSCEKSHRKLTEGFPRAGA